jgi:hypothetical protein
MSTEPSTPPPIPPSKRGCLGSLAIFFLLAGCVVAPSGFIIYFVCLHLSEMGYMNIGNGLGLGMLIFATPYFSIPLFALSGIFMVTHALTCLRPQSRHYQETDGQGFINNTKCHQTADKQELTGKETHSEPPQRQGVTFIGLMISAIVILVLVAILHFSQ